MKIHFDEKADALYFVLDDAPVKDSEEVRPGIVLDFDERDRVVGIEVLQVKEKLPHADLRQIQLELA